MGATSVTSCCFASAELCFNVFFDLLSMRMTWCTKVGLHSSRDILWCFGASSWGTEQVKADQVNADQTFGVHFHERCWYSRNTVEIPLNARGSLRGDPVDYSNREMKCNFRERESSWVYCIHSHHSLDNHGRTLQTFTRFTRVHSLHHVHMPYGQLDPQPRPQVSHHWRFLLGPRPRQSY